MNATPAASVAAALVSMTFLFACDPDDSFLPGTQVGVEEQIRCVVREQTVLTDLDAIPADFTDSPNDILAQLPGTFRGPLLADGEVPMGGDAVLDVAVPPGDVVLTTYDTVFPDDGDVIEMDLGIFCPPSLSFDVAVTLTADGFPTFDGALPASVQPESHDGVSWGLTARVDPRDDLDGALPDPTSFDPATVDQLSAELTLSGHADVRGVELTWRGETQDGQGEDGAASIANDLVYMAQMSRDIAP